MSGDINLKERSTRELMDWLKEHDFPALHNAEICADGQYMALISDYNPEDALLQILDEGEPYEYNGMKRWKTLGSSWVFYAPRKDKYYFMSI